MEKNMNHIETYLLENRLDSMQVGFFSCSEGNELISRQKLKNCIEFEKIFPNCVLIDFDINLYNSRVFPFKVFRISQKLIDLVNKVEIEENLVASLSKEDEFYDEIFKRFTSSEDMIEILNYEIEESPKKLTKKEKEKLTGKKKIEERDGDWNCFKCKNLNFSFRKTCNRCSTTKEENDKYNLEKGDELEMLFNKPHIYVGNKIVF